MTTTVGHVSELLSMVVPLYTLSGWPDEPHPSWLHLLGLLIGIPLLIFAVITLLVYIPALTGREQGGARHVGEPLWLVSGVPQNKAIASEALIKDESGGASVHW